MALTMDGEMVVVTVAKKVDERVVKRVENLAATRVALRVVLRVVKLDLRSHFLQV